MFRAARHINLLTWEDPDVDARTVTWRRDTDKLGKLRVQPLPRDAVPCFPHRPRLGPAATPTAGLSRVLRLLVSSAPNTSRTANQALSAVLRAVETKAGIDHIDYRGMHGLRRMSTGNALIASGGDIRAAKDWIGDACLRSSSRYVKNREVRQRQLAAVMSAPRAGAKLADLRPKP